MKKILITALITVVFLFWGRTTTMAVTTLSAGDIAFIGWFSDGQIDNVANNGFSDGFTFILLRNLDANTVIYFTDNGWSNAGWVSSSSEMHISWTVPTGGLTIGTIVYIYESSTYDVGNASIGTLSGILSGNTWHWSSSGDQILAYQSSSGAKPASPTFIAAFDADYTTTFDGTNGWSAGTVESGYEETFCALPPALTNGTNAVALFNSSQSELWDNCKYNGTLTGSASTIRTAINTYSNWTGSNSTPYAISPTAFSTPSITPDVPAVTSISPTSGALSGATTVIITGTNLAEASAVKFGSTNATGYTVNSNTQITATSPAGSAGIIHVTVTTPGGTSATSASDQFTYVAPAPTATTNAATSVTSSGATLNGSINANGASTVVTFEYGLTTSYGLTATAVQSPVTGSSSTSVSKAISGLASGTTYHYRVKGVNTGGTTNGSDQTFTTLAPEINIQGNSTDVVDGSTSPSTSNSTDFGSVMVGETVTKTFTIQNTGAASLTLGGTPIVSVSGSSAFTVKTQPSSTTVAGLSSTTFVVQFSPVATGTVSSEISIANNDSDENPYNFTIQGYGVWQPLTNNALDFDGSNDYVAIPDADVLDLTTTFTLEAWVNYKAVPSSTQGIISKYQITSSNGYTLRVINGGIIDFDQVRTTNAIITEANKWYHIAAVNDNGTRILYVNGISVPLTGTPITVVNNTDFVSIGSDFSSRYSNAKIDEVRIWNSVRSSSEIRENMMRSLNGSESGLVAYYRANETSGTTLHNSTSNSCDGALTNMDGATDWVDSEAFTTWIGTTSSDWSTATNWSDGFPTSTDNVGLYKWGSNSEATVTGSPTVENLMISSTSSPTLGSNITVNSNLILEKNIDLNGKTVTIGSNGTLVEDAGVFSGSTGLITTTRSLSNISAQNVGGLGATITTAANMGSTTISRAHGNQSWGGTNRVLRYYDITPTTNSGLNATLIFNYLTSELNSLNETNLKLFKSSDSGTTYTYAGGTVSTENNTITVSSLDGFSRFVAAESVLPTVTTQAVSDILSTTATGNGNITALGIPNPTSYGVCWNTTGTPTIDDSKVDKGAASVTGAFIASMTGLTASTTYHVRAFATNTGGTSYGEEQDFTTLNPTLTITNNATDNTIISGTSVTFTATPSGSLATNYFWKKNGVVIPGETTSTYTTSDLVNGDIISAQLSPNTGTIVSSGQVLNLDAGKQSSYTGSGSTWSDISGNNNNATLPSTLVSSYSTTTGAGSFNFQGSSSTTIQSSSTNNWNIASNNALSVETWIKRSNYSNFHFWFSTPNLYYRLGVTNSGYLFWDMGHYVDRSPGVLVSEGVWHHIVYTAGLESGNIYTRVYMDGVAVASQNEGISSLSSFTNYLIGDGQTPGQHPLNGNMGLIRVYNKTLSASEVLQNYNAELDRFKIPVISSNLISMTVNPKPTVTSVAVPSNGTYRAGDNLDLTVTYSEAVNVVTTGGTPYIPITLNTGGTVNAAYSSGSGTTSLVFRYTVVAGNLDADGIAVGASITANGGTLKNAGGFDANLTLNSVGSTTGVLIDAVAPTVLSVSSTTVNGTYKEGDAIAITISFSENVTVTGTPTLLLNSGGTAFYSSGSGSSALTFNYTVGSGQSSADLDYSAISSMYLSGGSINDAAGNATWLNLPTVGGANSLGGQKDIVIAIKPAVETKDAVSIASTTATIKGTVNANNASSTVAFEYGLTNSYGFSVTAVESPVSGNTTTNVSAPLTGLIPNATYHYRVRAVNTVGTSNGDDAVFSTLPATSTTFTGIGNWSDMARWSAGIPGTSTATTIDGTCTATGNYEVASLTITSGKLTINPDKTLKVTGSFVNNVGTEAFLLKSDASGTGKLVNNSTSVPATVQQYFVKGQWHYYTLPTTSSVNAYPLFYRFWVVKHNESTNDWTFMNSGDVITAGVGYGAHYNSAFTNDTVVSISGNLNTGDISLNTAMTSSGWNLIGNPYSCTVDWTAGITRTNVYGAIYLWNPVSGNYGYYVDGTSVNGQTQYIAPMQGFFVHGTSAIGSVAFTNAAKSTTASYFRSADINQLIRLSVRDQQGKTDETVIRIKDGATTNFDGELDAYKLLSGESLTPQLWSEYKGSDYAVNSIPDIGENLLIPLKVLPENTGMHEISLSELKDYNKDLPIYIYEENLEQGINIVNNSYSFRAEAGKTVNLYMSFTSKPTSLDKLSGAEIQLLSKDNVIRISGMSSKGNDVKIFNIDGKMVKRDYVVGGKLDVPVTSDGLYIVRIISDNGNSFTGKVVVK